MNDYEERKQARIQRLKDRAKKAAEKNNAISSDDPQAIEKLEQKLRDEVESYERIKADYKARGESLGYIANNANQRIRAIKERIAFLKKMRERVSRRYTVNGVDIFENVEDNRLQLFYPSKPDDETRALLKRNGFRWSPRNGAWQSYLKDVYYKLGRLGLREEEQCK